jgi:plastocyanin
VSTLRVAAGLAALALAVAGCGSGGTPTPSSGYVIIIVGDRFSPQHLQAPAGATVVVLNQDAHPHTATSAAAPGTYTRGEVAGVGFDTGLIEAGVSGQFTIPASAPVGTVVPYFDAILQGAMLNQADLTVTAP